MVRKVRKTVSKEAFNVVKRRMFNEGVKINQLASMLDLDRKTIRSIIAKINRGEEYTSPVDKRRLNAASKPSEYTDVETLLSNTVYCDSSLILNEHKTNIANVLNLNLSTTTFIDE